MGSESVKWTGGWLAGRARLIAVCAGVSSGRVCRWFVRFGSVRVEEMDFPDQNCFGCAKMIREKGFKMFNQKVWHKDCFKCAKCRDTVDDVSTMTFAQNNIYCTAHIEAGEIGTNAVCPTCNDKFQPFDKNLVNANRLAYHPKCFKCSKCDSVMQEAKEHWQVHDGKLLCTPCHQKEVVNKCIKCKGPATGDKQFVTQAGIWCPKCFVCNSCRRKLNAQIKVQELAGAAQLYCDRCTASYQKAKYAFEMNRPGV